MCHKKMFIISWSGNLVNKKSTTKLPIKRLLYWLTISSAKQKKSFTENSVVLIEVSLGTKYFPHLFVGVPIAERIGQKGGHTSITALSTLHKPYKLPGLLPSDFIYLFILFFKIS